MVVMNEVMLAALAVSPGDSSTAVPSPVVILGVNNERVSVCCACGILVVSGTATGGMWETKYLV